MDEKHAQGQISVQKHHLNVTNLNLTYFPFLDIRDTHPIGLSEDFKICQSKIYQSLNKCV